MEDIKLFKLMVCGSRTIDDKELIYKEIKQTIVDAIADQDLMYVTIIEGEAKGVDSIAKQYAIEHNLKILSYPADWNLYGRSAGVVRNEIMVKNCDFCLIFWDGSSKGTKNDIELCKKLDKPYKVITVPSC